MRGQYYEIVFAFFASSAVRVKIISGKSRLFQDIF